MREVSEVPEGQEEGRQSLSVGALVTGCGAGDPPRISSKMKN